MGDSWEEQRLEHRSNFVERHRLQLSEMESREYQNLEELIDHLYGSVSSEIDNLRIALDQISSLGGIEGSMTLRECYSLRVREPALRVSDEPTDSYAAINETSRAITEATAFGAAISSIMAINRLIPALNNSRKRLQSLRLMIRKNALRKMASYSSEFQDQALEVLLSDGTPLVISPKADVDRLEAISVTLSISSLMNWRAVN